MKVMEHGIGAPLTHQADGVMVNVGAEKRHGAAGTEGMDGDVGRLEAKVGGQAGRVGAEAECHHGGGRGTPGMVVIVGMQWGGKGGAVVDQMMNAAK